MSVDPIHMDNLCMAGVTLRSLLEKRDFLSVYAKAKITGKEYKVNGDPYSDAAAAFLGPNLWDKSLSDFKLEYLDLDDLLRSSTSVEENGAVQNQENAAPNLLHLTSPQESIDNELPLQGIVPCSEAHSLRQHPPTTPPPSPIRLLPCNVQETTELQQFSLDCKFSPKELALATVPGENNFNPASVTLQSDDLKPQPMIRKSQKNFVPDNLKDDRYWARRRKNNLAAKRSREARRIKENQIVLRASYLEKENNTLKEDVMRLKAENDMLRNQLKKLKH